MNEETQLDMPEVEERNIQEDTEEKIQCLEDALDTIRQAQKEVVRQLTSEGLETKKVNLNFEDAKETIHYQIIELQ